MSNKDHPVVSQRRQHRAYRDDATANEIAQTESLKLALLSPAERGAFLHHFDQEVLKHEDVSPMQQLQATRMKRALAHAHRKLSDSGR